VKRDAAVLKLRVKRMTVTMSTKRVVGRGCFGGAFLARAVVLQDYGSDTTQQLLQPSEIPGLKTIRPNRFFERGRIRTQPQTPAEAAEYFSGNRAPDIPIPNGPNARCIIGRLLAFHRSGDYPSQPVLRAALYRFFPDDDDGVLIASYLGFGAQAIMTDRTKVGRDQGPETFQALARRCAA